jgi:ABC-type sugar transport system ATPase subunit
VSAPTLLEVEAVSKSYGRVQALDSVSLDLRAGEVHALLGHNGAGKSTLMKILAGLVRPDAGHVRINGDEVHFRSPQHAQACGIAIVDQELSLVPVLTVEDNILLGNLKVSLLQRRGATRRWLRSTLDRLGLEHVALSRLVSELSIGERQLVEIARALTRDTKVLILDEPTATLRETEIELVFRAVRDVAAAGCGVIYVSHRLGEVLALCQRATVFRDGKLIATVAVDALDRDRIVELMLGEMPIEPPVMASTEDEVEAHVEIVGLSVPPRVRRFDLTVKGGQIVGLAGQIGSGTNEVLRALAGLVPDARGRVVINGSVMKLGSPRRSVAAGAIYTSNDRKGEGLFLNQSIELNLSATRLGRLSRWGVMTAGAVAAAARQLLALVGIDDARRRAPVAELSGGNQQKVFLGRSLEQHASHLLLLDEPTRGVDVGGRADIHHLVRQTAATGNAVIFSSTELDEILDLADVVVTMFAGEVVRVLPRGHVTAASVLTDMTHGVPPAAVSA